MDSPRPPMPDTSAWTPDIVGLRPSVTGVHIAIRCRACGHVFERYQATVAGVAIGQHTCPQCQATYQVWPEHFEVVLDRYLPPRTFGEMVQFSEEASRIAETWYRGEPFAKLLAYQGINLGEPTERELLSFITLGLYPTRSRRGDLA